VLLLPLVELRHLSSAALLRADAKTATLGCKEFASHSTHEWLPLHLALLVESDASLVAMLLDAYSAAAAIKDPFDHYALEIALSRLCSLETIATVRAAYPAAESSVPASFKERLKEAKSVAPVTSKFIFRTDSKELAYKHMNFLDAQTCAARAVDAATQLAQCVRAPPKPPAYVEVVVIGAGLTGLSVAASFVSDGTRDVGLLEKAAGLTGVWATFGNSFSRVNVSGPGYYLPTKKYKRDSVFHPYQHDILYDALDVINGHQLNDKLFMHTELKTAAPYNGQYISNKGRPKWAAKGNHALDATPQPFTTATDLLCMCTNRRLGLPRTLAFPGEDVFAGQVFRGLGDDSVKADYHMKNVVVIGFGAYAAELMRTALERETDGAVHCTLLARQLTTVMCRIGDFMNVVRPWDDQLYAHAFKGSRTMGATVGKVYATSGLAAPKQLKPDGGTLLLSDLYFIAGYYEMLDCLIDEIDRIEPHAIFTQANRQLPCDILHKCIGFLPNLGTEKLTGKSRMLGVGLVADGLWIKGEPHIDNGMDTNSPLATSIFYSVPWFCKILLRHFNNAKLAPKLLQPSAAAVTVRTNWFTLSEWVQAYRHLQAHDAPVKALFREYVLSVQKRFLSVCSVQEFVAGNMWEWEYTCKLLKARNPECPKPVWKFPWEEAALEVAMEEKIR